MSEAQGNGWTQLRSGADLAPLTRITLRPIASPLPLGLLALVPAGVTVGVSQVGGIPPSQMNTVGLILIGFVVPIQLIATVFCFLARDAVAATGLGLFTGSWLATGLTFLTAKPGQTTSPALGVFLLCMGATFVVLIAGASLGKLGPALVIVFGAATLTGLYELIGTTGLEHACAILGFCLAGAALYAGLATELEDVRGSTQLPMMRRDMAREALEGGFTSQLERIEHEAGVRQQL